MNQLIRLNMSRLRRSAFASVVIAFSGVAATALAQTSFDRQVTSTAVQAALPSPAPEEANVRPKGFVAVGFGGSVDNTSSRSEWRPNFALHVGGSLSPQVSLRLEVDIPSSTTVTNTYEQTSSFQRFICGTLGPGQTCSESPGAVIEFVESTVQSEYRYTVQQPTFAGLVGFEHRIGPRMSLIWLGGVVIGYRAVEQQSHTIASFSTGESFDSSFPGQKGHDISAGVDGGLDATIRVTRRLELVPNLRVLAVNAGTHDGTLLKTGVSVRWYF